MRRKNSWNKLTTFRILDLRSKFSCVILVVAFWVYSHTVADTPPSSTSICAAWDSMRQSQHCLSCPCLGLVAYTQSSTMCRRGPQYIVVVFAVEAIKHDFKINLGKCVFRILPACLPFPVHPLPCVDSDFQLVLISFCLKDFFQFLYSTGSIGDEFSADLNI